jgi:hypothetical protein
MACQHRAEGFVGALTSRLQLPCNLPCAVINFLPAHSSLCTVQGWLCSSSPLTDGRASPGVQHQLPPCWEPLALKQGPSQAPAVGRGLRACCCCCWPEWCPWHWQSAGAGSQGSSQQQGCTCSIDSRGPTLSEPCKDMLANMGADAVVLKHDSQTTQGLTIP